MGFEQYFFRGDVGSKSYKYTISSKLDIEYLSKPFSSLKAEGYIRMMMIMQCLVTSGREFQILTALGKKTSSKNVCIVKIVRDTFAPFVCGLI